jgi:hypothetical protein
MDLIEIVGGVVDWIGVAKYRYKWRALVDEVMNLGGSVKCWKLWSGHIAGGLSISTQLHGFS